MLDLRRRQFITLLGGYDLRTRFVSGQEAFRHTPSPGLGFSVDAARAEAAAALAGTWRV